MINKITINSIELDIKPMITCVYLSDYDKGIDLNVSKTAIISKIPIKQLEEIIFNLVGEIGHGDCFRVNDVLEVVYDE